MKKRSRGRGRPPVAAAPTPFSTPAELRALVRRDVRCLIAAGAFAVAALAALAALALDWLDTPLAALLLGLVALAISVAAFLTGPQIRDRIYLLGPAFLSATPVLYGFAGLTTPVLAFVVSVSVGLLAAVSWARWRRPGRV